VKDIQMKDIGASAPAAIELDVIDPAIPIEAFSIAEAITSIFQPAAGQGSSIHRDRGIIARRNAARAGCLERMHHRSSAE